MTAQIEAELAKILEQVLDYRQHNQVEELTYLVGAGMACLEELGCPIRGLRLKAETIIDSWANSDKAPARD